MQAKIVGLETLSTEQRVVADRILELLNEWIHILGLDRWELSFTFLPILKVGESEDDVESLKTCAETVSNWYYQALKITFYARVYNREKTTDADVEHVIIHELNHSMVQPMVGKNPSDRENEREEFVVTNLERAFMKLKYRADACQQNKH